MSALGVTDWYRSGEEVPVDQLVFGEYPLAFLQEAARSIGAAFFETYPRPDKMIVQPGVVGPSGLTAKGSMLPVSPSSMKFTRTNVFDEFTAENCDHDSVAGWTINADGSVRILAAAIVADSRRQLLGAPQDGVSLSLSCLSHGVPPGAEMLGDICEVEQARIGLAGGVLEYLEGIYTSSVNDLDPAEQGLVNALFHLSGGSTLYAVASSFDGDAQQGLILAEASHQNNVGPKILVKVGCYLVEDLPSDIARLPESTAVDWLVL